MKIRLSKLLLQALLICTLSATASCLPKDETHSKSLNKISINDQEFYIPQNYYASPRLIDAENEFYLAVSFPGFLPVEDKLNEMFKTGNAHEHIKILVRPLSGGRPLSLLAKDRIRKLKATEVVGQEYGLVHRAQKPSENWYNRDVWTEESNDGLASTLITCTEKQTPESLPQCWLFIREQELSIKIDFDKRLLKDWKQIKLQTGQMLNSFKSRDKARRYIEEKLPQEP